MNPPRIASATACAIWLVLTPIGSLPAQYSVIEIPGDFLKTGAEPQASNIPRAEDVTWVNNIEPLLAEFSQACAELPEDNPLRLEALGKTRPPALDHSVFREQIRNANGRFYPHGAITELRNQVSAVKSAAGTLAFCREIEQLIPKESKARTVLTKISSTMEAELVRTANLWISERRESMNAALQLIKADPTAGNVARAGDLLRSAEQPPPEALGITQETPGYGELRQGLRQASSMAKLHEEFLERRDDGTTGHSWFAEARGNFESQGTRQKMRSCGVPLLLDIADAYQNALDKKLLEIEADFDKRVTDLLDRIDKMVTTDFDPAAFDQFFPELRNLHRETSSFGKGTFASGKADQLAMATSFAAKWQTILVEARHGNAERGKDMLKSFLAEFLPTGPRADGRPLPAWHPTLSTLQISARKLEGLMNRAETDKKPGPLGESASGIWDKATTLDDLRELIQELDRLISVHSSQPGFVESEAETAVGFKEALRLFEANAELAHGRLAIASRILRGRIQTGYGKPIELPSNDFTHPNRSLLEAEISRKFLATYFASESLPPPKAGEHLPDYFRREILRLRAEKKYANALGVIGLFRQLYHAPTLGLTAAEIRMRGLNGMEYQPEIPIPQWLSETELFCKVNIIADNHFRAGSHVLAAAKYRDLLAMEASDIDIDLVRERLATIGEKVPDLEERLGKLAPQETTPPPR